MNSPESLAGNLSPCSRVWELDESQAVHSQRASTSGVEPARHSPSTTSTSEDISPSTPAKTSNVTRKSRAASAPAIVQLDTQLRTYIDLTTSTTPPLPHVDLVDGILPKPVPSTMTLPQSTLKRVFVPQLQEIPAFAHSKRHCTLPRMKMTPQDAS